MIYGWTLTPFEGALYSSEEDEAKRQAVNAWIRTSGTYDAVIDFVAVVRDSSNRGGFCRAISPGTGCTRTTRGIASWRRPSTLPCFETIGYRNQRRSQSSIVVAVSKLKPRPYGLYGRRG